MNRAERRRQKKIAHSNKSFISQNDETILLQQAVQAHKKGELLDAEAIYKRLLKNTPHHPEANNLLGTLIHQKGQHEEALIFLEKAALSKPNDPNFFNIIGIVARAAGHLERAEQASKHALSIDPNHAVAHNSLALILQDQKKFKDAVKSVKTAISLNSKFAEAYNNLGNILLDIEQMDEAVEAFKSCLALNPNFVKARFNLALTFQKTGQIDDAITVYQSIIKTHPNFAEAYSNYANLLRQKGQASLAIEAFQKAVELNPNRAENYYNLGLALAGIGKNKDAAACFEGAYTLKPDFAFAHSDYGNALLALGQANQSIVSFKKAISLVPNKASFHNNLAHAYIRTGQLHLGKQAVSNAIKLDETYARAYNNLGIIHQEFCEFDEAQKHFSKALELDPNYQEANSNLLFAMNYHPNKSGEEIFKHYQEFSQKLSAKVNAKARILPNERTPNKRIKVGYVAPTFYNHAVSHHLMPLFDNCTHENFEVYAYADLEKSDKYTEQYKKNCDHFRLTKGLSDEQLANLIQDDSIDILVDIAGHTRKNRLGVFTRKPAPIALHWLDFGYTTGMPEIDYYMGDENVTPEGQDHLFGENQVWRLNGPSVAYRPPSGMGEISELPAIKNGYITFCTLSRTVRLNHKTLKVWADILHQVPNSKLRFDSRNFGYPDMCDHIIKNFEALGIDKDRLILGFNSPPWDTLREIDIALDCFPHNSGTTLFEHLYMGNPYVTLYNRASVGTLGGAILRGGGFGEWVASNEQEYIDIAKNLALDIPTLQKIRSTMREKMKASPLMDEKAFVGRMEGAYREMWHKWCAKI